MNLTEILTFIEKHKDVLSPIVLGVYELLVRLFPTSKNWSIIDRGWKIINFFLPNKRTPQNSDNVSPNNTKKNIEELPRNKHILMCILILLVSSFTLPSYGQLVGTFQAVRFGKGSPLTGVDTVTLNMSPSTYPIGTLIREINTDSLYYKFPDGFWHPISGGGSGGGLTTADNGLTVNPASNVQLGGPLTQHTTINGGEFDFSLIGTGNMTFETASPLADINISNPGGDDIAITATDDLDLVATGNIGGFGAAISFQTLTTAIDLSSTTATMTSPGTTMTLNNLTGYNLTSGNPIVINANGVGDGNIILDALTGTFLGNTTSAGSSRPITAQGSAASVGVTLTSKNAGQISLELGNGNAQIAARSIDILLNHLTGPLTSNTVGYSISSTTTGTLNANTGLGLNSSGGEINIIGNDNTTLRSTTGQTNVQSTVGAVNVAASTVLNLSATDFTLNTLLPTSPSTEFFRGDGTWAVPAGGGGITNTSAINELPKTTDGSGNLATSGVQSVSAGNVTLGLSTTGGTSRTITTLGSNPDIAMNLTTLGQGDVNVTPGTSGDFIATTSGTVGNISLINGSSSGINLIQGPTHIRSNSSVAFGNVAQTSTLLFQTPTTTFVTNGNYGYPLQFTTLTAGTTLSSDNIVMETGSKAAGSSAGATGDIQIKSGDISATATGSTGNIIIETGDNNGTLTTPGNITIDVKTGELFLIINRTDCTGAPSGSIANVSGTLTVCP